MDDQDKAILAKKVVDAMKGPKKYPTWIIMITIISAIGLLLSAIHTNCR